LAESRGQKFGDFVGSILRESIDDRANSNSTATTTAVTSAKAASGAGGPGDVIGTSTVRDGRRSGGINNGSTTAFHSATVAHGATGHCMVATGIADRAIAGHTPSEMAPLI
jgi:hypothetical protein